MIDLKCLMVKKLFPSYLRKVVGFFLVSSVIIFLPSCYVSAQDKTDQYLEARVIDVLKEEKVEVDGVLTTQQDLKLRIIKGEKAGQEIFYYGVGNFDVLGKNIYRANDKVLAIASIDEKGEAAYYVTDYIRNDAIVSLVTIFIVCILAVGLWRGARSLVSLLVTFIVVIQFIIPEILGGSDPLLITFAGSMAILLAIIYLSEGFNKDSNTAIISILGSLLITIGLSWFFVAAARLTGFSGEEMSTLVTYGYDSLNFRGLLLAGIIIGSLGVLDDVVLAQIAAVKEIHRANPDQAKKDIFKSAYKIGVTHINSMTNTLFLAYAGASLPLIALIVSGQSAFSTSTQIINNEEIATEIIRTLTGSIGLISSVPIATALAVWRLKK